MLPPDGLGVYRTKWLIDAEEVPNPWSLPSTRAGITSDQDAKQPPRRAVVRSDPVPETVGRDAAGATRGGSGGLGAGCVA